VEWNLGTGRLEARAWPPAERREVGQLLVASRGFIANAREIRERLDLEESVATPELLLASYRRWGSAASGRLCGPLSWVVTDGEGQRLTAVACRTGHPRLYYRVAGQRLRVAGSVDALLEGAASADDIDESAVAAFLSGAPPPRDRTFFRSIRAVPPGHALTAEQGRWRSRPYWQLDPGRELRLASDGEYGEALLSEARRIVSEYLPNGTCGMSLSGGVDSSSLAVVLEDLGAGGSVVAFSLVAAEIEDSELSAEVARHLGIARRGIEWGDCWPLSGREGLVTRLESPNAALFGEAFERLLGEVERGGIRVLLTGWGGDGLFGGSVFSYPDLLLTGRWLELARQLGPELRSVDKAPVGLLIESLARPLASPLLAWSRRYRLPPAPWLLPRYRRLYRDTVDTRGLRPFVLPGRRKRWWLLTHPGEIHSLEPQVRACERAGVDLRNPFSDHRFKEFAVRLPSTQTHRGHERKFVARNLLKTALPESLVARLGKHLAGSLAMRGLRERETAKVWALLDGMRAAELGIVDERRLRAQYADLVAGRNEDYRIWFALSFEAWLRQHF
jgi:asparagine synthase (glutamine-hydrolysing)